jgi:hypothetical protein
MERERECVCVCVCESEGMREVSFSSWKTFASPY